MPFSENYDSVLIDQFYQAGLCPELWQEALTGIAGVTGSRGALLPTSVFTPGHLLHSAGMGSVLGQFFEESWHERDQRTTAARAKRTISGFVADQDLFTPEEIQRSEYYDGFARHAGVPWFAAALLTDTFEEDYVALSLQRSEQDGAFQPDELGRLNALLPHLRSAVRTAIKMAGIRSGSMLEGLNLGSQAAILLDRNGKAIHMNALCRTLLDDGLSIRHKRLRAENVAQDTMLGHLIQWACGTGSRGDTPPVSSMRITSSAAGQSLVVSAAPLRRSAGDILGFQGAILLLTPLGRPITIPDAMLETLYGLTKREAQILSFLGAGNSVATIADRLLVSREAVRFHLKGIFAKTGVHRQTELVTLCNELAVSSNR